MMIQTRIVMKLVQLWEHLLRNLWYASIFQSSLRFFSLLKFTFNQGHLTGHQGGQGTKKESCSTYWLWFHLISSCFPQLSWSPQLQIWQDSVWLISEKYMPHWYTKPYWHQDHHWFLAPGRRKEVATVPPWGWWVAGWSKSTGSWRSRHYNLQVRYYRWRSRQWVLPIYCKVCRRL